MLAGQKPFAQFVEAQGQFLPVVKRYLRLFDCHVASGKFVRRDYIKPPMGDRPYPLHRIMFALPGEEWRFDAYVELSESPTWGPDQERREGELLGYADWMNDHFLKLKYGD